MALFMLAHAPSPLVAAHIAAGALGMAVASVAVLARKGAPVHRAAGGAFVLCLVVMAGSAGVISWIAPLHVGVLEGMLGVAFAVSGWGAARSADGMAGPSVYVGLALALGAGGLGLVYGARAAAAPDGLLDGYPASLHFVFAGLALFAALFDATVLWRGGVSGAHRIARHLWRLLAGFFFATGNFFIGQQKIMPESVRGSPILLALGLLPLGLLVFWLFRVLSTDWLIRRKH